MHAVIFDMLCDEDLMCKNLTFTDIDIAGLFRWTMKYDYNNFDQSGAYNNSVREHVTNYTTQLLMYICICMVGAILDYFIKSSLCPVVMTLVIYNRSTHSLGTVWRCISCIPNFN